MEKLREGGFLISKVKQISGRIFDKKLLEHEVFGLNSAQGRIIFALWKKDHIPIQALACETALGKTTLTSMLERLEQAGYLKRAADIKDKRKVYVSLTEKTNSLKENYMTVSNEMTSLFYKGLTESEISGFEDTLHHILNNLIQYEEEQKS